MHRPIPVAGAIVERSADQDPLVVEADPASEVTRCLKNVARFVFRVVQELQWSGHAGDVRVAVVGDGPSAGIVAPNVAALLAPLLTVCVLDDDTHRSPSVVFDVDRATVTALDPPSPRDRIWLAPAGTPGAGLADRYDLVIGLRGAHPTDREPDLSLIVVAADDPRVTEAWLEASEAAVILDGSMTADHPEYVEVIVT